MVLHWSFFGWFCWDVIALDISKAVQFYFQTRYLQPGIKYSFMTLLPNMFNACFIDKYRPISMENFLF